MARLRQTVHCPQCGMANIVPVNPLGWCLCSNCRRRLPNPARPSGKRPGRIAHRVSEIATALTGSLAAATIGLSLVANGPAAEPKVNVWRGGKLGERLSGDIVGRASVIDGDTIEVHGTRVRLWGIDAPEGRQRCFRNGQPWRCGTSAANALASFLGARTVSCHERDRDRWQRMVAVCKVAGQDVGAWLVRQGWALDFTRYSNGAYSAEQNEAERERRGLWQGEFEPPWEWRRR